MHIMMARMTPFSLHFGRCTDSPCSIEPVKIPLLHRRFYTQIRFTHAHTLSHTNAFTHRRVDTQTLLHTDAFTRRCFLHTHTRFHTQTLLHTDAFTHRHLYRNESVHRNFSSVFDVQRPFRAKGLRLTK